ncbi:MAG: T9SS type A sorting domain-containing protein [Flavobacteriales bacterium]
MSVCAYDSLISVEADTVGVFGGGLSGSGITSDPVDPSLLGSGTYPFTFMVTGTNGCQVTLFDSLHVLSVPQVSLELGFTEFLVNGEAHVLTNEGTPPGGVYTLDDDPTPITTINGEGMSLGPHTLFYTYDSLGCVGTASVVFYAEIGTGVHTAPASPFILVPNPAHDQCVVWFPGSATARIMMHDAVGRIVGNWTSVSSPYPLDLGAAPPGTYMLSVEQDGSVRHVRLIVQ